jgi:hypothetical protein
MKFELPPPIPSKRAAPLKSPEHSKKETTAQTPKVVQRGSPPPPPVTPSLPPRKISSAKQPQPSVQRPLEPALLEFEAGIGTTIPPKSDPSTKAVEPPKRKGRAHLARDGQQTSPRPVVNPPGPSRKQDIDTQSEPSASPLRDQRRSTGKRWLLIGSFLAMLIVLGVLVAISSNNPSHPPAEQEKPPFDSSKPFEVVQEQSAPASTNSVAAPETPAFDPKELAAKNALAITDTSPTEKQEQPASPTPSGLSYDQRRGVWVSSPPTPAPQTYRVVNVREGDAVNIRQGPGSSYPVVARIPPGVRGIILGPRQVANGSTIWQEISVAGYVGWVNEVYLEAETAER